MSEPVGHPPEEEVSGRYQQLEPLSAGSRFTVTRARRVADGRSVVLKVVAGRTPQHRCESLLRHERELLDHVRGPGIPEALALERLDGRLALVLEDMGPYNLAELISGRPLPTARFLVLAIAIAELLERLHDRGVIHRDICPTNFVVGDRLALVDFEVSTQVPAFSQARALPGELEGTLAYMAPEQTGRTRRSVDYRADLYAVGATFYEMLTGAPPFRSSDPLELLHAQVALQAHAPALIDAAIPTQLSSITMKLLSKMPEWRYQTASALRRDLEDAQRQWLATGTIDTAELGRQDVPFGFLLSGRVYGREAEIDELEQAIVARDPSPPVVLVSGQAGIGKTALVEQLLDVHEDEVRCLSGKSDLLRGNLPFGLFVEALAPLIHELLELPPSEAEPIAARINAAISPNGRVLTDLFPELENLIGEQPSPVRVGPAEAENRLHRTFGALMRALGGSGPRIALFLDDLQWADTSSLKLFHALAAQPELRSFLLIGAYRSEEVTAGDGLGAVLEQLEEAGTPRRTLRLGPLEPDAVRALLADGLRLSAAEIEPLAELVHSRTAGNPFFVRRFMSYLHQQGALTYRSDQRRWSWDYDEASAAGITSDVAELLARVLSALSPEVRRLLETAACIGNRFSLPLLAELLGEGVNECARQLWSPVREGMIAPVAPDPVTSSARSPVELRGAPAFRFTHDRIQQAAYKLLGDDARKALHRKIGERLLAEAAAEGQNGRVGPIVDHLNRALELFPEPEQRRLAQLNEQAGREARARCALGPAAEYFMVGLSLMPKDAAEGPDHALWFQLLLGAAECSAYSGSLPRSAKLVAGGLSRTSDLLEQAALYSVIVRANALRGDHLEALQKGREAARLFGVDVPERPSGETLADAKARARAALNGRTDQQLLELPKVEDEVECARQSALADMVPPAWFTDPALIQLIACNMVELTASRGRTPASLAAFPFYGISLALDGEYEEARRYGELGVRLAELSGDTVQESRALLVLGGHLLHWCAPLRDTLPLLQRSFARGVESGELQFAAYALANLLFSLWSAGGDLDEAIAQAHFALAFYREHGHRGGVAYIVPVAQAARCLKGLTRSRASFDDETFDEAQFEKSAAGNDLALAVFHLVKLETAFLLGESWAAQEHARRGEAFVATLRSIPFRVDQVFYRSLVLADALAAAPIGERAALVERIRANLGQLEAWAEGSPQSFEQKRRLIAAELAAAEGRPGEALDLFHGAIQRAGEGGFTQDEALAHERCARFTRGRGDARVAALHLRAAVEGYSRWGASAKVQALEEEFPTIAGRWLVSTTAKFRAPLAPDYVSLLEVAETLSAELVLDKLLVKLTRICIEVAAAQRAVLVLDDGGLQVRAVASAGAEPILERTPLARAAIPAFIVEEVLRSGELLVIGDASRDERFSREQYLKGSEVKSLLAVPIGRGGRRFGALLFENNLSTDAFSEDRVELFRLLSGELAVALENSLLFEERRRAEGALRLLSDVSAALVETLDSNECLRKFVSLVVPAMADWCIVDLVDGGRLSPVAFAHADPQKTALVEELHRRYPIEPTSLQPQAQALRMGKALLVEEVDEAQIRFSVRDAEHLRAIEALNPRSVIAVPLLARGHTLGSALFVRSTQVRYGASDRALAQELARRLSMALDNSLLHRGLKQEMRQRIARERLLSLTFRQLPGAVWRTDRELKLTFVTGSYTPGRRPRIGASIYDFLGTTEPTNPGIAHHLAALSSGERQSFQYQFLDRWFAVLIEPFRAEDGRIAGCIGAAFDVTDRRQMEERLRKSEASLADAQRVAHVGSFEWNIGPNEVSWSDELHRIYGMAPGEFPGTFEAFMERVPPEERDYTRNVIFDAYRGQKPFVYDHRVHRMDGTVRILHTRGDVVTDEHGKPVKMIGVCWDVTELKRNMQELEQAVSRWEATLNATAEGILVVDREDKIVAHNERFVSLLRIPRALANQQSHLALLAPIVEQLEDPSAFWARLKVLKAHPEEESTDVLRFKDGRAFERHSTPQRLGGETVGRVWSIRDITERERLYERAVFLADSTRLLGSLDVEPALESVARMAVPLLGDVCAVDLFEDGEHKRLPVISRDGKEPAKLHPHSATLAGHPIIHSAGGWSLMAVPLLNKDRVVGAMTFAAEASRRYGAEDLQLAEELARRAALSVENARLFRSAQKALQAREEFLAIAAHEIRGPLTSVHMAVQGILRGSLPPAAVRKALEIVEREDRRLSRFVDELLDVGRIRSGRLSFTLEEVDLGEVVHRAASALEADRARSGSPLSIETEGKAVGQWDRFRLEQVVTNLLSNAMKFGGGKPITVTVHADKGRVWLAVRDEGVGIAPQAQKRIFRPFERAVATRQYGGLGLGLYIIKTIVEGLGGTVSVQSAPGEGSTFTVELPMAKT